MSYIVPRDIPKTCDECPFSAYSSKRNSLVCTIDPNCLCVERDTRYAFCRLIEVKQSLFSADNARKFLKENPPKEWSET